MKDGFAHIAVTNDVYLAESPELKGVLSYTMDIGQDAQLNFVWSFAWKSTNAASAVETGVKFLLPAGADEMTWLCDSRWTEYPPDHIGRPSGTITSKDISFAASKRGVRWMSLFGGGKYSVVALNAGDPSAPLAARARAGANGTTFYLTSAIAGPSGELSGSAVSEFAIRLTPDNPVGGAFRLRVAAKP
jgi:hypothetical protein